MISDGLTSIVYKAIDNENNIFAVKKYKYYNQDEKILSSYKVIHNL